ncbi:MAG: decarboxylase, partial [Pseudomonadota bacterium]
MDSDNQTTDIQGTELEPSPGTRSGLESTLASVIETGRDILAARRLLPSGRAGAVEQLTEMCQELREHRGEASGLALASEITEAYRR